MVRNLIKTAVATSLLTALSSAATLDVTVTNLTNGSYFTPLLLSAHPQESKMFMEGEKATSHLQAMAEGGDISGLSADFQNGGGVVIENPAGGLLAPGSSTTTTIETSSSNDHLSIVAMILPTNDGFVALNSWSVPHESGTYTINLNAYDAGTEANDEIVNGGGTPGTPGIPADPSGYGGTGATGVTSQIEGFVHIHRGILGDQNKTGGVSDLSSSQNRWLNPVATVKITVK